MAKQINVSLLKFKTTVPTIRKQKVIVTTVALEINVGSSVLLLNGHATKFKKDAHCKVLAQKAAIISACKQTPSRAIKTVIWQAFYNHSKAARKILSYKEKK